MRDVVCSARTPSDEKRSKTFIITIKQTLSAWWWWWWWCAPLVVLLLCCAACAKKKRRVITAALVYTDEIISKLGLNENVCPARTGPGHLRVAAAAPTRTNWLFFHHFMLFLFTYELVAVGGRRLLIDLSVQTAAEYNHKRPLKSFFCVLTHDKKKEKKKKLLNYIFPLTFLYL